MAPEQGHEKKTEHGEIQSNGDKSTNQSKSSTINENPLTKPEQPGRLTTTTEVSTNSRGVSPRKRTIKTGWIFYLNKRELTGYLRECGMDDIGTVDELRRRFTTYINGGNYDEHQLRRFQELEARHTSPPQTIPPVQAEPEESALPAVLPDFSILDREPVVNRLSPGWALGELPAPRYHQQSYQIPNHNLRDTAERTSNDMEVDARTYRCVREWGLKYDGRTGSIDFIDRIEELAASQRIPLNQVPFALSESLSDIALSWWRNRRTEWTDWTHFKRAFLRFFLPTQYWENLEDEIRRRKQGWNELCKTYVLELESLMRHTGLTPSQKLDRIYKNSAAHNGSLAALNNFLRFSNLGITIYIYTTLKIYYRNHPLQ